MKPSLAKRLKCSSMDGIRRALSGPGAQPAIES
jgi:hypothetical protein